MTIRSPLRPSHVVSPLVSRTRPRSTSRVASASVDGGGAAPAGGGGGPFQLLAGLCIQGDLLHVCGPGYVKRHPSGAPFEPSHMARRTDRHLPTHRIGRMSLSAAAAWRIAHISPS